MNHDDVRGSLGSYLLGALGPAERQAVDAHLAECTRCRDELFSYAGLPGLLSRLDLAEVTGRTLLPPPSLLPSVLAAVERERWADRRRILRWHTAAAGVSVAAVLAGALSLANGQTSVPARPLVAAAGVIASGTASLRPRPWGTEFYLQLQDLPPANAYTAYAVDGAGAMTPVATWGPTRLLRAVEVRLAYPRAWSARCTGAGEVCRRLRVRRRRGAMDGQPRRLGRSSYAPPGAERRVVGDGLGASSPASGRLRPGPATSYGGAGGAGQDAAGAPAASRSSSPPPSVRSVNPSSRMIVMAAADRLPLRQYAT